MRKITNPIATDFRLLGLMLLITLSFCSFSAAQQTNDEIAQDVKAAFVHGGPGIQAVADKYGRAPTIQHLIRHIRKTPQTERGRSSSTGLLYYYRFVTFLQTDLTDSKEDAQLFTDSTAVMLHGLSDSSPDIRRHCMEWLWKNWASSQEDYDRLTNVAISIFNSDDWSSSLSMIVELGAFRELPSSMHSAMLEFALTNFESDRQKFTMIRQTPSNARPVSRVLREKAMRNLIHHGHGAMLIETAQQRNATPIMKADIALAITFYTFHGLNLQPREAKRVLLVSDPEVLRYLERWLLEANQDLKLNQYLTTSEELPYMFLTTVHPIFYDLDEDLTGTLNQEQALAFYRTLANNDGPLSEYAAHLASNLEEQENAEETPTTTPTTNSQ